MQRVRSTEGVTIVAVTDKPERRLILTEQFRPPFGRTVIELPAGLVGDSGAEAVESAIKRELREETGFECKEIKFLCFGSTSPGLTDETNYVYQALYLTRIDDDDDDIHHADGSVTHAAIRGEVSEGERITVHEVPLQSVSPWLEQQIHAGKIVDLRVYAGLAFAMRT